MVLAIICAEYPALAKDYEAGPAPDPGTASSRDHGRRGSSRVAIAAMLQSPAAKFTTQNWNYAWMLLPRAYMVPELVAAGPAVPLASAGAAVTGGPHACLPSRRLTSNPCSSRKFRTCERCFICAISGIYVLIGEPWRSGPVPGSAALPAGAGETGEADARRQAAPARRVTRARSRTRPQAGPRRRPRTRDARR
jgi:hypothetical protein